LAQVTIEFYSPTHKGTADIVDGFVTVTINVYGSTAAPIVTDSNGATAFGSGAGTNPIVYTYLIPVSEPSTITIIASLTDGTNGSYSGVIQFAAVNPERRKAAGA